MNVMEWILPLLDSKHRKDDATDIAPPAGHVLELEFKFVVACPAPSYKNSLLGPYSYSLILSFSPSPSASSHVSLAPPAIKNI